MTEVLVALIGGVALVVVAAISNRTRQHAKATREQVQNSHSTNLREELDERHGEIATKLDYLVKWQTEHQAQSMRGHARTTRLELTTGGLVAASVAATVLRLVIRYRRKQT